MANKKVQQRGAQGKRAAEKEQMLIDQRVMNDNGLKSVVKVSFLNYFDYPVELQNEIFKLFMPVTVVRLPMHTRSGIIFYMATAKRRKMFELFQLTDELLSEALEDEVKCVLIHLKKG